MTDWLVNGCFLYGIIDEKKMEERRRRQRFHGRQPSTSMGTLWCILIKYYLLLLAILYNYVSRTVSLGFPCIVIKSFWSLVICGLTISWFLASFQHSGCLLSWRGWFVGWHSCPCRPCLGVLCLWRVWHQRGRIVQDGTFPHSTRFLLQTTDDNPQSPPVSYKRTMTTINTTIV